MEISYSFDDRLIFDKEIKFKDVIKFTGKIVVVTLLLISCGNLTVFAATPWYKKAMTDAEISVYLRLVETVGAERIIKGIKALEDTPKEIIQWCVDKGYLVEEIISWYIENK